MGAKAEGAGAAISEKRMSSEAAWGWLIVWLIILGFAIEWWKIVGPGRLVFPS